MSDVDSISALEQLGLDQEYIDQHPVHLIPGGHDFQLERRPITGGWEHGMWCSRCGSRMNQAPDVCPGRKGA